MNRPINQADVRELAAAGYPIVENHASDTEARGGVADPVKAARAGEKRRP
ncbi:MULTISPECIES: hypothetical protein [Burkholderiaceae]|nr:MULTISPECIES: hypothetical protein [Burkholderiaceae]